jgi:hypothetical protein
MHHAMYVESERRTLMGVALFRLFIEPGRFGKLFKKMLRRDFPLLARLIK